MHLLITSSATRISRVDSSAVKLLWSLHHKGHWPNDFAPMPQGSQLSSLPLALQLQSKKAPSLRDTMRVGRRTALLSLVSRKKQERSTAEGTFWRRLLLEMLPSSEHGKLMKLAMWYSGTWINSLSPVQPLNQIPATRLTTLARRWERTQSSPLLRYACHKN